ncbi:MAG: dUTPase [Clostridiales bacterium]|nr:dUTPase [Clostridiales bacterium]
MDKLDRIFQMQRALDEEIVQRRGLTDITNEEWLQKDVLAILSELGELLNELNFKWWKNDKELNMPAIREEMADILHFFISMCMRAGMGADALFALYLDKNKENFDRQHGLSKKPGYALPGNET